MSTHDDFRAQGVKWIVMNEPSYMGRRQLDEYRRAVGLHGGSKASLEGRSLLSCPGLFAAAAAAAAFGLESRSLLYRSICVDGFWPQ